MLEKFSKAMLKRNKGVPFQVSVSPKKKTLILQSYLRQKKQYVTDLNKNMKDLLGQKIDKATFIENLKQSMKSVYSESYKLGKFFGANKYSDLDDNEKRFVTYQVTKEMQFMEKFATDMVGGHGQMPYSRRLKMYSDSLDAMFGFGRLVYLPEDIKIIWQLGVTDKHCPDCLMFAAQNPYTKKTLPGYPKSGNSRCLSACLCSLIYYYNNNQLNSEYDNLMLSGKQFSTNKVIPTEDEYSSLLKTREAFYYNRLMYERTKNDKYLKFAKSLRQEFGRQVRDNNFYMPVDFAVRRPIADFKAFNKNSKFQFAEKYTDVVDGDFVSVFLGDKQVYGRIIKRIGEDIFMKSLDSTEYSISPDKNIIYKEIP